MEIGFLLCLSLFASLVSAWSPNPAFGASLTHRQRTIVSGHKQPEIEYLSRRNLFQGLVTSVALWTTAQPAQALVKGVAPPPKSKPASDKPKCTNIEECQAAAQKKEQEEREAAAANLTPPEVTKGGTRFSVRKIIGIS